MELRGLEDALEQFPRPEDEEEATSFPALIVVRLLLRSTPLPMLESLICLPASLVRGLGMPLAAAPETMLAATVRRAAAPAVLEAGMEVLVLLPMLALLVLPLVRKGVEARRFLPGNDDRFTSEGLSLAGVCPLVLGKVRAGNLEASRSPTILEADLGRKAPMSDPNKPPCRLLLQGFDGRSTAAAAIRHYTFVCTV